MPPSNVARFTAVDWDATLPGMPHCRCANRDAVRIRIPGRVASRSTADTFPAFGCGMNPCGETRFDLRSYQHRTLPISRRSIGTRHDLRSSHCANRDNAAITSRVRIRIPGRVASRSTADTFAAFGWGMSTGGETRFDLRSCHPRTLPVSRQSIGMRPYRRYLVVRVRTGMPCGIGHSIGRATANGRGPPDGATVGTDRWSVPMPIRTRGPHPAATAAAGRGTGS